MIFFLFKKVPSNSNNKNIFPNQHCYKKISNIRKKKSLVNQTPPKYKKRKHLYHIFIIYLGKKKSKYNKNFLTLSSALLLRTTSSQLSVTGTSKRTISVALQVRYSISNYLSLCFVFFFAVIFLCYDKVSFHFGKVVLSLTLFDV